MQDGDGTFSFRLTIRVLAKMEVLLAIFQEQTQPANPGELGKKCGT
jgi:hypothetical protein